MRNLIPAIFLLIGISAYSQSAIKSIGYTSTGIKVTTFYSGKVEQKWTSPNGDVNTHINDNGKVTNTVEHPNGDITENGVTRKGNSGISHRDPSSEKNIGAGPNRDPGEGPRNARSEPNSRNSERFD